MNSEKEELILKNGNVINQVLSENMEKVKMILDLFGSIQSVGGGSASLTMITLGTFRDEYMKYVGNNRSDAYLKSVVYTFHQLCKYFPEQRIITSISIKEIENFFDSIKKDAPRGMYVYYRNLRAAFTKAEQWDYISSNPFKKIKLPKKMRTNPAYINEEQLGLICSKIKSEKIRDMIVLAFYSGMRLAELVNLTWQNVDLQNKIITVGDVSFETKSKSSRVIPLADEAFKVLNKRVPKFYRAFKEKFYVFAKANHQPYSNDCISKTFKRACRNAGISEQIHFHSLRHSTASFLVGKGVSIYTVSKILGHSSVSTTQIYSHLDLKVLKDAISVFN